MTRKHTFGDSALPRNSQFLGFLEGGLSIGINTILFFLKLWAGARIASVAMVADAWHTLSDSFTSLVVILGFWLCAKPADKDHHFGHGRAEPIASLIIGTLLAVVGVNFLKDSITRLTRHQAVSYELLGILIFLSSAIIKEGLAQFSFWAGKKTHSRSLHADGWHHRSDAIASGLIVLGALFSPYFWWTDGVLGIGVSLLILYATYTIIRSAASFLLGESPGRSLENQINEAIRCADGRLDHVHHLHIHDYGGHKEATVHVKLPGDMSLDDAHEIATKVEKKLKDDLNLEITIHVEPVSQGEEKKAGEEDKV